MASSSSRWYADDDAIISEVPMPQVTLELPPAFLENARRQAERIHQPVEKFLVRELEEKAEYSTPSVLDLDRLRLIALTDDQLLVLIHSMAPPEFQERISDLMWRNNDGALTPEELAELDEMLVESQLGNILKARAMLTWKERHGVLPPGFAPAP